MINPNEITRWSEEELEQVLQPIEDQMNLDLVPFGCRPVKGWQLFKESEQLAIQFHHPASNRIIDWFRHRCEPCN